MDEKIKGAYHVGEAGEIQGGRRDKEERHV